MATKYTIGLHTGMKLHLTLDTAPVDLQVEFTDHKKVNFHYDPSTGPSRVHSTIGWDTGVTNVPQGTTGSVGSPRYKNRVTSGTEWIEYESTNALGSQH